MVGLLANGIGGLDFIERGRTFWQVELLFGAYSRKNIYINKGTCFLGYNV
jgi:hypothetical protein